MGQKGRNRGLLFSCLFAASLLAIAIPQSVRAQASPPNAAAVAQKVDDFYNRLRSLRASFTETYSAPGEQKQESGVLLLERPGKMRWDYDAPKGKVFLTDGKDAYFYAPGTGEAQRMSVKKLDDMRTPLRFLLGRTHLAKELDGLAVSGDNGVTRLHGVPKFQQADSAPPITQVSLDVLPSGEITRIQTTQADGAAIIIVLGSQELNVALPPAMFQFTPPPGVKVVEGAGTF